MTVTKFQDYKKGKLTLKEVEKKETKDKETGKLIKYNYVKFNYDHPVNGGIVRGYPYFEICSCTTPRGLVKEGYKLNSFTIFDINDPEVRDCIDIKERTEIEGWVKKTDDLDVKINIGSATALVLNEVNIYDEPDSDNVLSTIAKDTILTITDNSEDSNWFLVKTGGKDGFFTQIYHDIARIIYDNKVKCGLGSLKSIEETKGKMKPPIYWHKDESNNFVKDKKPSTYLKYKYFGPKPATNDKPASKENYVDFKAPGTEESLDLKILLNCSLTFKPVIQLFNVYIGAGKITPQFYVNSAVVTDIEQIEYQYLQEKTLNEFSKDTDLVKKLQRQLEASKFFKDKAEPLAIEKSSNEVDGGIETDSEETVNLENMLSAGPKSIKVNLDDDEDDDDINIPGLPSL